MASINCPRCSTQLHHYVIDVVAGGGAVTGPGLACHACGRAISPHEVRSLLAGGGPDPFSELRRNASVGKHGSSERVADWWLFNKDLIMLAAGAIAAIVLLSGAAAIFISPLVGIIIAVALTAVAVGIWVQDIVVAKRREKAEP